jgi:hypothetical protein
MSAIAHHWADVVSETALSSFFQSHLWIIPTSQSIHIACVSVVFACAGMISLRLLGVGARGRTVSQLVHTLVPWMYRALVILLLTGVLQTIAESLRQFVTPALWLKMLMIICVVILTTWFARAVRRNAAQLDSAARRPMSAKVFALVSLALWIEREFIKRVGLRPKLYARVPRFHYLPRLRAAHPALSWMVVSHEAGYFDQNHLVKEFWQLTGNAPSSMGPVSEDWNPSSTLEPNKGVRHFDIQSVIPGAIFQ